MSDDLSNEHDGLAEGPEGDTPMSFFEHLVELRKRLVRAAFGVTATFVVAYVFIDRLTQIVLRPYRDAWIAVQERCIADTGVACLPHDVPQLQNLTAFESVMTDLRIAIIAAIFMAAPILFYELWMFIAPGLYQRERRLVVPFVATSAVMFLGGAVFCFYLVLPLATEFLLEYPLKKDIGEGVRIVANYTYQDVVQYVTRLLLGFGLMFEFPLGVFFLAKAGIVTHVSLLRFWRPMVLICFVVAAILTPPEPISQLLMAAPMMLLYGLSVGVAYVVGKPERERLRRLDAELAEMDTNAGERGEDPDPQA